MTDVKTEAEPIYQRFRGDGTTTRQLKATPHGAHYVTPSTDYTRHLAHFLGRGDLKIESLSFFESRKWCGLKRSQIVIDHAAAECMERRQALYMYEILEQMHD